MNDFFKTKVGFTIGLLAAVFAFKPLVDSNSNWGFTFFDMKITVEYAYISLTAFLGVAVYFISLQFASSKHFKLLDKVSNACYTMALVTPLLFLLLWFLVICASAIERHIDKVTPFMLNIVSTVVVGSFAYVFFTFVSKSMKHKFLESERRIERDINIQILTKAQELMNIGMYDMSVVESNHVVETLLKRLLESKGIMVELGTIQELTNLAKEYRLLNHNDIDVLQEIRKKRNESIHTSAVVTKEEAQRILHLSKELVIKLDAVNSSTGYEWLESHRGKVLQILKRGDSKKSQHAIKMIREAWINRDGVVYLELAEFFEMILSHNPSMLIDVFGRDEELFQSWLESMETQLFCALYEEDMTRMNLLKRDILSSLKLEIDKTDDIEVVEFLRKILKKVEKAQVTVVE